MCGLGCCCSARLTAVLIVGEHLVDLVTLLVLVDAEALAVVVAAEDEEDLVVLRDQLAEQVLDR